jgi:hypothetical protein
MADGRSYRPTEKVMYKMKPKKDIAIGHYLHYNAISPILEPLQVKNAKIKPCFSRIRAACAVVRV